MDSVATGEVEHLALSQVRSDFGFVNVRLNLIGNENQENVRPLRCFREGDHFHVGVSGLFGIMVFHIADDDLASGVAQVLRLSVTLAAEPDGSDQFVLEDAEIRIVLKVKPVSLGWVFRCHAWRLHVAMPWSSAWRFDSRRPILK